MTSYGYIVNCILIPQIARAAWSHDKGSMIALVVFTTLMNAVLYVLGASKEASK